jgi:hypothetical protein
MKSGFAILAIAGVVLSSVASVASAQTPTRTPNDPPAMLLIFREEVKPGRNAAHTTNEIGWAGMMAKASWPTGWLGATSVTGPNEAWFFTGFDSLAAYEKDRMAQNAAESLRDAEKFAAQEGDLLTRTSTLIGAYRPALSYQGAVNLPKMRYFSVDTVVVKPGHVGEFVERWEAIVAAHTKGKVDEHWAVYEITSGGLSGTYLFFYAMDSLATIDASGPKHRDTAYRDAVGESGRSKNADMTLNAIERQENRIFEFNPKMSYLSKAWTDTDPEFWAPKPEPVPPAPKKK